MHNSSTQPLSHQKTKAPRRINGKVPPGCKTIQIVVSEWLYYRIQTQASLSCMDPPDYLYHFLQEAFPVQAQSQQQSIEPVPAQDT